MEKISHYLQVIFHSPEWKTVHYRVGDSFHSWEGKGKNSPTWLQWKIIGKSMERSMLGDWKKAPLLY